METEFTIKREVNSGFSEEKKIDSPHLGVAIIDDKEYFDEYFKICESLQKKRVLLNKLKDHPVKVHINDKSHSESYQAVCNEIAGLNYLIKQKEDTFWDIVDKAKGNGQNFVIEKLTKKYSLDVFEKRVLLFFLYLEFYEISRNVCSEDELLGVFDLNNSAIWRMCNFIYFSSEGRLVKNAVLCKEYSKEENSAFVTLALSSRVLTNCARMLNGKKMDLKVKGKEGLSICTEVGFVKTPEYKMDGVILKEDVKEKVLFFLSGLKEENPKKLKVSQKIKKAKGLTFLFYGPPGTGKSMLAEAVADHLKKKLLMVEFSKITSRWYGDTDKNISKIFAAARKNNLVVCMDEADSLLYNRNFAAQEHDIRFVNEMLMELERFEGVAVLTTNMDILLDQALERRISLRVKFELPNEKIRTQIWRSHIPGNFRLSEDVDFPALANRYSFAGGYIKNAVLNTLRRAALNKQDMLTMEDFIFGANIEREGMFNKENLKGTIGFATQ